MEIKSMFTFENGDYSHAKGFHNRRKRTEMRTLKLEIRKTDRGDILDFIGGPTGFESYYIPDLNIHHDGLFCICGGTINSWPNATVEWADVYKFLSENGYAKEETQVDEGRTEGPAIRSKEES